MANNTDLQQLASQFSNLEMLSRQLVEGFITGLHKSPYHGFSVEFAEHKAYNPGESVRYIDWKLYGRTDRLYTRRFEEETNLRCQLLIDVSPSMYYPRPGHDKVRFACLAAACLAYMLQRQRDAVGVATFAGHVLEQTRIRSTSVHLSRLFALLQNQLNALPAEKGETHVASVLHQMADQLGQRALVVVFSDMMQPGQEEEVFSALQHLRHNKHEVILFHILHQATELALDLPGRRTYLLTDAETGDKIRVRPKEIQESYRAGVESWLHATRLRCAQQRIDFVEVDTAKGVEPVLQAYLARRARIV